MLEVMTFNIRYGTAADGRQAWPHRAALVIDRIRAARPDLVGLQECRDDGQVEALLAGLPEYGFHGARRGHEGDAALEMAPLLYRRSTFRVAQERLYDTAGRARLVEQRGHLWLSETPEALGSVGPGAAFPRTLSWITLEHRATGKWLTFVNTHLDYEAASLPGQVERLRRFVDSQPADRPIILTGDFNVDRRSAVLARLARPAGEGAALADALLSVPGAGVSGPGTYHGFSGVADASAGIDGIWFSPHLRVQSAAVDRTQVGGVFPSDHFPCRAAFDWA